MKVDFGPATSPSRRPRGARHILRGMAHPNSFDARSRPAGRRRLLRDLPAGRAPVEVRRGAPAVLAEDPAREPAAHRGQRVGRPRRTSRRWPRGTRSAEPSNEIAFTPARVLMQDFTGVPAVVDLAAMRDAMVEEIGGDPAKIKPLVPAELVIDHSVQVDFFGTRDAPSATPSASSSATRSATRSCAGARAPSTTSPSCRRTPASSTRSTSSTWRASCSPTTRRSRPTPTRSSGPTRTRRWSTGSACWAGASAASRPRRRCSASRCRCSSRRCSASS